MTPEKLLILIHGYINENTKCMIPLDLVRLIMMFFVVECRLYDQHMKEYAYNNNITNIYPNGKEMLLIDTDEQAILLYRKNTYIDLEFDSKLICVSISNSSKHVYVFTGKNELYQVSVKHDYYASTKKLNTDIIKSRINQIRCGESHTLLLSELGNVYGFGSNKYYELTNSYKNNGEIQRIKSLDYVSNNISKICCGVKASVVLDNNGYVSTFGFSHHGMLGLKLKDIINYTGNVNTVKEYQFKIIDCGSSFVIGLTQHNELMLWGRNILGWKKILQAKAQELEQLNWKEVLAPIYTPKLIHLQVNNAHIQDIRCGTDHIIIRTYHNNYYCFGAYQYCQTLLFKDTSNYYRIYKPYIQARTNILEDIIDIIPGYETTYILQKRNFNDD